MPYYWSRDDLEPDALADIERAVTVGDLIPSDSIRTRLGMCVVANEERNGASKHPKEKIEQLPGSKPSATPRWVIAEMLSRCDS